MGLCSVIAAACACWDSWFNIMTKLQAWLSGVWFLRQGIICFCNMCRLAVGPSHPLIQMVLSYFAGGKVVGVWSWPLNLYFVPKLRMSGVVSRLPICLIMMCTGTALPFHVHADQIALCCISSRMTITPMLKHGLHTSSTTRFNIP